MDRLSARQKIRLKDQVTLIEALYTPKDTFRCIDLGTEYGHTGRAIREAFPLAKVEGVEIHADTLLSCQRHNGQHYQAIHLYDALEYLEIPAHVPPDIIIAAELIEHMEKAKGYTLLDKLRRSASFSIVTSPLGFMKQGARDGNPYQNHISGWLPEEFITAGWNVFATHPSHNLGVYFFDKLGRV